MALKNLFDMAKADRYTQDGREALIKAQEAETEDKVYQIGEISQKTGLQKTANGWVKPKNGGAGSKTESNKKTPNMNAESRKHAEARKDRESSSSKQKLSENYKQEVKEFVASATPERIQRYIKALRTPFSIERDNFEEPDKLAAALEAELKSKKESKPAESKPVEQMSINELKEKRDILKNGSGKENDLQYKKINDELAKKRLQKLSVGQEVKVDGKPVKITNINPDTNRVDIEFKSSDTGETMKSHIGLENIDNYESIGETESKPTETPKAPKPTVQEYMKAKDRVKKYKEQYKKEMDDYEYMERIKANGIDTSMFNPMYGGKPKPLTENKSYMEELKKVKAYEAEDAAPRVLTGDTRIRVRKA